MSRRIKTGLLFSLALSLYLALIYALMLRPSLEPSFSVDVRIVPSLLLATFVAGAGLEQLLSRAMGKRFFRRQLIGATVLIMLSAYVLSLIGLSVDILINPEDLGRGDALFFLWSVALLSMPLFFLPALPFGITAGLLYPNIVGSKPLPPDDLVTQL